ncbi:MAG: aspartate kinase [Actinomycetota bacterium]
MAIVVQKFGGSSVANIERLKNVAERVVKQKEAGDKVVVVVSALGDTTNELLEKAHAITKNPSVREMDVLLATGEQISIALLAMAIQALGHDAISFSGSQAGIVTDTSHTKAKIVDIKTDRLLKELNKGNIVIVAGFQGATVDHDTTTLGRGGSDLTAIALAARLKAASCDIFTDVEGVFTTDPRLVKEARKLPMISYEEMLEMAASGAQVMQLRAVEYARNYGVPIHVRSSFSENPGTIIKGEKDMLEKPIISGISYDASQAKVTILDVPDKPGIAAKVFSALAKDGVNVDTIIQNVSAAGFTDISFTVERDNLKAAKATVENLVPALGAKGSLYDADMATVSLIGAGMKTHPGVAADMFGVLSKNKINIEMISTSPIKISCVIKKDQAGMAVKELHKHFKLDKG